MADTDKDDLHPNLLSRCCTARVLVVEKKGRTDHVCTKCGLVYESYVLAGAKTWPPNDVLKIIGVTREEWDDMAERIGRENLPMDWVIETAMKKVSRRRRDELARGQW